jgi:hypothetical protein
MIPSRTLSGAPRITSAALEQVTRLTAASPAPLLLLRAVLQAESSAEVAFSVRPSEAERERPAAETRMASSQIGHSVGATAAEIRPRARLRCPAISSHVSVAEPPPVPNAPPKMTELGTVTGPATSGLQETVTAASPVLATEKSATGASSLKSATAAVVVQRTANDLRPASGQRSSASASGTGGSESDRASAGCGSEPPIRSCRGRRDVDDVRDCVGVRESDADCDGLPV